MFIFILKYPHKTKTVLPQRSWNWIERLLIEICVVLILFAQTRVKNCSIENEINKCCGVLLGKKNEVITTPLVSSPPPLNHLYRLSIQRSSGLQNKTKTLQILCAKVGREKKGWKFFFTIFLSLSSTKLSLTEHGFNIHLFSTIFISFSVIHVHKSSTIKLFVYLLILFFVSLLFVIVFNLIIVLRIK